jgi:acetyl esterase
LFDPSRPTRSTHRRRSASRSLLLPLAAILLGVTSIELTAIEAAAPVRVMSDLVYSSANGEPVTLDAYVPPGGRTYPGIVMIHGGRWTHGDKADLMPLALAFAADGVAVFAVNYRLAPQYPYPAAAEDVALAVEWIRGKARDFDLDPRRIGAFGGSAGGFLAATLATSGEGSLRTGSRVAAAASWSGPLDLASLLTVENRGVAQTIRVFLGCETTIDCTSSARVASPISHVDPTDAPLLIANSTGEVIPASQAQEMAASYESHGLPYDLTLLESTSHGLDSASRLTGPTIAFFRRHLGASRAVGPGSGAAVGAPSAAATPAPSTDGVPSASEAPDRAAADGVRPRSASTSMAGRWLVLLLSAAIVLVVGLQAWLLASHVRGRRGGS